MSDSQKHLSMFSAERGEASDESGRVDADSQRKRHAELMDTVGRLAGGIAHDFNNVLASILGYTELLDNQLRLRGDCRAERNDLNEIQLAAERGQEFTQRLLSFAQRLPTRVALEEPQQVVRGIERLLRRLAAPGTELMVSLTSTPGHIDVDRSQLERALTNVVLNGYDAMPDGGTVALNAEWRNVSLEGLPPGIVIGHSEGLASNCIEFRISDSGRGMSADSIRNSFLPFESSRDSDAIGTGLGLSAVYGIVAKARGVLLVESALQIGTTVHILIPRADTPPDKETST